MDQGVVEGETSERAELTFFIETQLTDAHPGVIRVRELRKGVKRFMKHSHVFLYQLDRGKESIGETIARMIYEDQTENRVGRYKGPRWDWKHDTQLHLIQVIEHPEPSLGGDAKPLKREVGTAYIPGELDAADIIARIAQVIDKGLKPPPDEAYLSPEPPKAPASTIPSSNAEHPFPLVVQCVWNYRTLVGPVVFIATEEDGVSIDQCAVLLEGEHDHSPSSEWYHLFRFEDDGEALLLRDQGVHERTEPILLYTEEGWAGSMSGSLTPGARTLISVYGSGALDHWRTRHKHRWSTPPSLIWAPLCAASSAMDARTACSARATRLTSRHGALPPCGAVLWTVCWLTFNSPRCGGDM